MNRENRRQKIGFGALLLATLLVVIPVIAIIVLIVTQGFGALSWEFLFSMPRDGMRAGGIFPAIVGTVYLVFISLAVRPADRSDGRDLPLANTPRTTP